MELTVALSLHAIFVAFGIASVSRKQAFEITMAYNEQLIRDRTRRFTRFFNIGIAMGFVSSLAIALYLMLAYDLIEDPESKIKGYLDSAAFLQGIISAVLYAVCFFVTPFLKGLATGLGRVFGGLGTE